MVHERRVTIAAQGPSQDQAELCLAISGASDSLLNYVSFFDDVGNFFNFDSHFHVLSRFDSIYMQTPYQSNLGTKQEVTKRLECNIYILKSTKTYVSICYLND